MKYFYAMVMDGYDYKEVRTEPYDNILEFICNNIGYKSIDDFEEIIEWGRSHYSNPDEVEWVDFFNENDGWYISFYWAVDGDGNVIHNTDKANDALRNAIFPERKKIEEVRQFIDNLDENQLKALKTMLRM